MDEIAAGLEGRNLVRYSAVIDPTTNSVRDPTSAADRVSEISGDLEVSRPGELPRTVERKNAFDLLRLLLALSVVYTHAHLLGGFGNEAVLSLTRGQVNAGVFAVLGFFGISGFLVTRSFATRMNWRLFIRARILRIVPGFYFSLLCTGFILAPLISSFDGNDANWRFADAIGYVSRNAFLKINQWSVGGIVADLPYPNSINGSLWSLFPEVCCYGGVFLLGIVGAFRKPATVLAALLALLTLHIGGTFAGPTANLLPTLLSLTGWTSYVTAFAVGMVIYCFRDSLDLGRKQALLWLLVVMILLRFGGWALLGPIALPLALIHLAYSADIELPADFSYGIYILHFPILQTLAAAGVNRRGLGIYLVCGVTLTLLCSAVSWYSVERPMLKLKRATSKPAR